MALQKYDEFSVLFEGPDDGWLRARHYILRLKSQCRIYCWNPAKVMIMQYIFK